MRSFRTSLVLAVGLLCACGSSNGTGHNNSSGAGGAVSLGGQTGSGGSAVNTNTTAASSGGAKTGVGGAASTGGKSGAGGASTASGGALASGGAIGTGNATGMGGATGTGGKSGAGGASTSSGGANTGGSTAQGGSGGSGGSRSSVGTGGNSTGGTTANGGGGTTGVAGSVGSGGTVAAGGTAGSTGTGPAGPCDIYQSANTPCGAAHSTVRALYASYSGPLYQVQRASDKTYKDIPVGSGGFADSAVQDSFCSGTTCTIPIIYDQSPNGNHLRVTWFANWLPNGGKPAPATAAKITVGGHVVYGIKVSSGSNVAYRTGAQLSGTASVTNGSSTVTFSSPQTLAKGTPLMFAAELSSCSTYNCPYFSVAAATTASTTATLTSNYSGSSNTATTAWNEGTQGVATGDQAEAIYAVLDGTSHNAGCCFDYGNSEINGVDDGAATMETIYWGADTQFGQSGGGSGPWVGADFENGLSFGYANGSANVSTNTPVNFPYVTAMLKGQSGSKCPSGLTSSGCFALKAGNAQSGTLAVKFDATTGGYGARPPGYNPMKKTGGVILGTGGDGSASGIGIWFEGAVTMGVPPDATDDAVQANIVATGYGQ